ncbi:hypothetical protein ACQR16_27070 [Bradyrhizobium oligotrophicum]|uniref:hypothetical protein n=1 Tax=Bradyrhizobium oligotrophicum TaxID=44255 RepID=UPI003EB9D8C1
MTNYTIAINNVSGFAKSYMVFTEPPLVSVNGRSPSVYANAWVTFPSISNQSFDSVTASEEFFAYWGTPKKLLAGGVQIGSGGYAPIEAGESVGFSAASSIGTLSAGVTAIGFGPVAWDGSVPGGSFGIVADQSFTAENGLVFGMAKFGRTPIPTPVATFMAEPGDTFYVTPVVKYYVTEGLFDPGTVINISEISQSKVTIDFTGRVETTATVTQQRNGGFSVGYSI